METRNLIRGGVVDSDACTISLIEIHIVLQYLPRIDQNTCGSPIFPFNQLDQDLRLIKICKFSFIVLNQYYQ